MCPGIWDADNIYILTCSHTFVELSDILKYSQTYFHLCSYVPMHFQYIDIIRCSQNIVILRCSHIYPQIFLDISSGILKYFQILSFILPYIYTYVPKYSQVLSYVLGCCHMFPYHYHLFPIILSDICPGVTSYSHICPDILSIMFRSTA